MSTESVGSQALEEPHALARRRQQKPNEEDEPALPRHALALDPNAWLSTLKLDPASSACAGAVPGMEQRAPVLVPEDLQNLISALARRVAWGGDRRRGSARIELSDGPLAGATLLVHADAREVSVELELPQGAFGTDEWRNRIQQSLEERGFVATVRVA